uniref:Uncharacterized protein n=1 Tax=Acrobeloides nanus TaxID=290746 RepID=A0A914EFR6_9BILA
MAMWVYFSVLLLSIVTIHAKSFMMIIECDENKQDISRCSINVPNLNESHREDPHNLERALKERVIEDKLKESAIQYYNLRFKKTRPFSLNTLIPTTTTSSIYDDTNTTSVDIAEKPTMEFNDSCNFWKKISFKC